MAKRSAKNSASRTKTMTKSELEQALLNNFVNLQKVLTNLSAKFEELSDNISKLLQLFEISAKSFAEKNSNGIKQPETDKEFLKKLDSLLDQNKTIARGIMLMEEKIRQRNQPSSLSYKEDKFTGMLKPKHLPKY